jgi:hypothetical protein
MIERCKNLGQFKRGVTIIYLFGLVAIGLKPADPFGIARIRDHTSANSLA